MNATLEQLAQTALRIKKDMRDERSLGYEFRTDGDWCEPLRRLPFSCPLWRAIRAYETARAAYEAEVDTRQRWRAQLEHLSQYLHEVKQEHDPDSLDYKAYGEAKDRAEILAYRITDPHERLRELKDVQDRADANWGRLWSAYLEQKEQERAVAAATLVPSVAGYDGRTVALQQLRERIAQYEAPQG
jgi:hypothetical protein